VFISIRHLCILSSEPYQVLEPFYHGAKKLVSDAAFVDSDYHGGKGT
jgi:hypothetical protein